ncbi:MAG: hypothetical protein HYZ15_15165 [Sphingobacteriales bacterium]|nr:hypothetical protein [Sphingobacteriales bacterium]
MKKQLIAMMAVAGFLTVEANGQQFEKDPNVIQSGGVYKKREFKTEMPAADKADTWEVKGISGVSFAASNTADGSNNSFKHALRITVNLVMSDVKAGNYQLVFYSEGENIPYAVSRLDGVVAIYYPVAVYNDIREKLEQAFATRRKVQIKVSEKTTGYREGVLVF